MLNYINIDLLQIIVTLWYKVSLVMWAETRSSFISSFCLPWASVHWAFLAYRKQKNCPSVGWYQLLRQLKSCLLVSTLPLLVPLFLYPSSLSETITAELREEMCEVTVGRLGYHREWPQAELMNTWDLIAVPVDCIFHHTRFRYSRVSHAGHPVRNCAHQSTDAVKEAF